MEDKLYMNEAIKQAKIAFIKDEVPIGTVIVYKNKIISKAYNNKEKTQISTKHAEIIAIEKACKKLDSWRLEECVLYTTLEPCMMCAGAIVESRIKKIICAATKENECSLEYLKNHNIEVTVGIKEEDSLLLLKNFFLKKRQ